MQAKARKEMKRTLFDLMKGGRRKGKASEWHRRRGCVRSKSFQTNQGPARGEKKARYKIPTYAINGKP